MKKLILFLAVGLGLFAACNPVCDNEPLDQQTLTSDQIKKYCTITVEQENGKNINHVIATCSAPVPVMWSNGIQSVKKQDADFKMLVTGEQSIICKAFNADGTITEVVFSVTIDKISDKYPVEPQWGYLYGDGQKAWTWDTEFRSNGGAWGNMGYKAGSGASFVNEGNGIWFACNPDELTGQLAKHSDEGAVGEESRDAYMVFTFEGTSIQKYKPDGTPIGKGGVLGFDMTPTYNGDDVWAIGSLSVTERALLFPFQINAYKDDDGNLIKGKILTPTEFEVMQLDDEHLKLVFAEKNTGNWGEATWWAFKAKK